MSFAQKKKLPKNLGPMGKIFGATARVTNAGMNRPGVVRPKSAMPKGWGSAWKVRKR
jgi:hypothetical protein